MMENGQHAPDQGAGEVEEGVWHPPNQNALLVEAAPPAMPSTSHNYADGAQMVQGYHAQAGFEGAQYQDLRPSFSGAYHIGAGTQQELFQAAHSTYGRMTPPGQGGFGRHDGGDSEAIPAYPTIGTNNNGQLITNSTVDSSSIQQGYLVLDQDNQVVAVQRVVSPTDCTVSQSTINVGPEGADGQPSTSLLPMTAMSTGSQYVTMQVTSMPNFSSHGEVSTSSSDRDPSVSSLGGTFHPSMVNAGRKMKMETTTEECDTTQEDLDCHPHIEAPTYLHTVSLAGHTVGIVSEGLHSTMINAPRAVTATVTSGVMEESLDSNQLPSLQGVSLDGAGPSSLGGTDGDLDRTVDSSAISDIDGSMGSDSDSNEAVESSNLAVESSPFRVLVAAASEEDKENRPSTSGTMPSQPAQPMQQTRKSTRIASQQEETSNSRPRLQYEPRPYSTEELWCEECQSAYSGQCPTHRLAHVSDKVVLSRAWASLPSMLQIYRLPASADSGAPAETAVFAKKQIAKMSQFGPFVGDLVDSPDKASSNKILLMLEKPDKSRWYFDTSDENKCNWMMFVRPAATFAEQNLVAYQHGQDIYFTVSKTIEPRQELKVWYAAHYAEHLGMKAHEPTDADWALMDEQACRFQCGQCSKKFRTSMAMQKHLLEHERDNTVAEMKATASEEEEDSDQRAGGRKGRKRGRTSGKGPLLKTKNRQGEDAAGYNYQWKKKSTSIYLNKTLKKYQKRPGLRQPIRSLYRRRGQGSAGGQEWVCTHCDLTFDNANVLNLHTLAHAAEDIGLDEIRKLTYDPGHIDGDVLGAEGGETPAIGGLITDGTSVVSLQTYLVCPMCRAHFDTKQELIEHAATHAKAPRPQRAPDKPNKCQICWKVFTTQERFQKHLLCHGDEAAKPLECEVCLKRFMNNSALACHLKTHSEKKYYECPLCHEGYDHITALKEHVVTHADSNGTYTCPYCVKSFEDFNLIRKHMRSFHPEKQYACPHCNRMFPRPDKLKLHMLRHTSHREFMCETCGRQFKRKDKLKEHIKRMHSAERETRPRPEKQVGGRKFIPKVLPTDYHRFIYKCHTCLLGFKRRGMLVNHLAKRHPDVKPDSVPELNLPILKTQRDYYCQHCDKVYKSSSKRKAHILKNHPGAHLPPGSRKKMDGGVAVVNSTDIPGTEPLTFSQTVGSITTMPHKCEYCHKQYASKAKLMQHQRKSHTDLVPPSATERRKPPPVKENEFVTTIVQADEGANVAVEHYDDVVVAAPTVITENLQAADLLTQAMSELTQTLQEYRPGTANITVHAPDTIQLSRLLASAASGGTPTLLQVQPNGTLQPATIELSHLTQALGHTQLTTHPSHLSAGATLIAAAAATNTQPQQQVISAQPINISVVTSNGSAQAIPVSISGNQAYVPRTWASTFQTFQR